MVWAIFAPKFCFEVRTDSIPPLYSHIQLSYNPRTTLHVIREYGFVFRPPRACFRALPRRAHLCTPRRASTQPAAVSETMFPLSESVMNLLSKYAVRLSTQRPCDNKDSV
jgi:hypothetical protein